MHTVEGRTDLVKDPNTGAIINIDDVAHRSAVAGAKARERAKQQLNNNTEEINSIKEEVLEINSIKEEVSEINIMMKPLLDNNVMGINSIKEEMLEIKLMMKQLLKRFDDGR